MKTHERIGELNTPFGIVYYCSTTGYTDVRFKTFDECLSYVKDHFGS